MKKILNIFGNVFLYGTVFVFSAFITYCFLGAGLLVMVEEGILS